MRGISSTFVARGRVTVLLVYILLGPGCAIPYYSTSKAPPGALSIQNAESGQPVSDALILVVKGSVSGIIDGKTHGKCFISRAFIFDTRKQFVLHSEANYGIFVWAKNTTIDGFIVVAPGYAPKFFFCRSRNRDDRETIVWPLRPIVAKQANRALDDLRSAIDKGEIGLEAMRTWDVEPTNSPEWLPYPGWPAELELSRGELRMTIEYLDRAKNVILNENERDVH